MLAGGNSRHRFDLVARESVSIRLLRSVTRPVSQIAEKHTYSPRSGKIDARSVALSMATA
jgi:hypothetical protein